MSDRRFCIQTVTVAYRIEEGEWYCTALQFDILGTGATREEAFAEMRELLTQYLLLCIEEARSGNPTAIFQPSEDSEWDVPDVEVVNVQVSV